MSEPAKQVPSLAEGGKVLPGTTQRPQGDELNNNNPRDKAEKWAKETENHEKENTC